MNLCRAGLVGLLVACLGVPLGLSALAATSSSPTSNVTAAIAAGRSLGPNPQLRIADALTVTVTGFAARAAVTMDLPDGSPEQIVYADGSGVVHVDYVVPAGLANGQYVITFSAAKNGVAPSATASGFGDHQPVAVAVPVIGVFPFQIGDPGQLSSSSPPTSLPPSTSTTPSRTPSALSSTSAGGVGAGGSGGSDGSGGSGGGGLSYTGVDVMGAIGVAVTAFLVGATLLYAARRKRCDDDPGRRPTPI